MTYREDGALLDAYAGLYNMETGAGTRRDKSLNFSVNLQAANISREECSSLFKTSGLVQKIVALLPEDSPVEWYSLNLGKDTTAPQEITNYLEDKLDLHSKLVEASVLARLHRNAYIVMFANDGRTADQPLDEDNLQEIVELKVLSSYELRPSVWGTELGGYSLVEPEYYDLVGLWELNRRLKDDQKLPSNQIRIHKSRVLRFAGRKLYGQMLQDNQGEDLSVLQSALIAFGSYMQGVMASSGMIQDYSVFTYKLKGLADLILKGQSEQIIRRFLAIQMGMSYNKGLAMDADTEEAGFVQRNYGGVGDIIDRLKAFLTAESGLPHTKLWGEGSQGNTSGQSEKYDYADALEAFQRHNWLKPTKVLTRLCLLSKNGITKGKLPEGWRLSTRSSLRLDLETEAKLRQTQARTDQVYRLMGVLHPLEIRKNRFGSPDYSMETVLDPAIDKKLWSKKDDPEFLLPVLAGKPTAPTSGENVGSKVGTAHSGTDAGTKLGQAAIAGTGGDGGNNAEMLAQESDRDRMSENRRTDEYERRDATAKQKLRWGDRILAVEFLPGDIRHNRRMQGIYGYIQKHTGHDNQPLDFYATPEFHQALCNGEQPVGKIFEVYQLKANSDDPLERKMLNETKIILGCNDAQAAIDLYLAHMPPEFLGLVNDLTPEELRHYRYRRDGKEFIEDSKKRTSIQSEGSSSQQTGRENLEFESSNKLGVKSAPSKRSHYDPDQKRGKDGRWIETGAENKRNNDELPSQKSASDAQIDFYETGTLNSGNIGTTVIDGKKYFVKGIADNSTPKYEELSSRLGKTMGLQDILVPVQTYRIGNKDFFVSPHLGEETKMSIKKNALIDDIDFTTKAIVYDYLLDTSDRHIGNVYMTKDGRKKLIDNELVLGNDYEGDFVPNPKKYLHVHNDIMRLADEQLTRYEALKLGGMDRRPTYSESLKNRIVPSDLASTILNNRKQMESLLDDYEIGEVGQLIFTSRMEHLDELNKTGKITIGELLQLK